MANYRLLSDIMETVPENNEGQDMFSDPRRNLLDEFAKSTDVEFGPEHMKVFLRIRPLTGDEVNRRENQNIIQSENDNQILTQAPAESHTYKNSTHGTAKSSHRFTFSKIFKEDISQKQFFEETMLKLVKDFIDGQNCLVFTYGVTSSGKTYTVQGNPKEAGILPRALDVLFNSIEGKQWPSTSLKPKMFTDVIKLSADQELAEQLLKEKILKMSCEDDTNMTNLLGNDSTDTSQVNNTTTGSESSNLSYLSACTKESVGSAEDLFCDIENRVREEAAVNVEEQGNIKFSVWVSFAEIYNEQIYDLLEKIPSAKKKKVKRNCLKLSEDRNGSPYIRGLKEINVTNGDEAYRLLKIGQKNLRTACTKLNHSSSRSHCIFTIKVLRVVDCNNPHVARVSMLSLCDLAGSERQSKSHTMGERVKEAGNINTSLLTLGRCVETLRFNQAHKDHPKIVPFRDSKLTRLFQNFFSGRGKAAMIININQCASMFDETLCVLKFSAIAKQVVVPKHEPKPLNTAPASELDVQRNSIEWETSVKVAEAAAVPLPGGEDDDDLDNSDSEIAELLDIIEDLRKKVKTERREKVLLEARIRDKVCQEMMEQLVKIEQENCERVRERELYAEERAEQRMAMLMESVKKPRKRPRQEQAEYDDDDKDVVSSVLLQSERIKVKERDQVIAELRSDVAALKIQLSTLTEDREKNICEISTLQFQIAETKCNAEASDTVKPDGDMGNSVLMENLTKQLEEFRSKLKEQEKEIKELTQSLNEAGEAFQHKEEEIEKMKNEMEKLKSQLAQDDERNHYQERLIDELKNVVESSKYAVDDANNRLSVQHGEIEKLHGECSNLQGKIEQVKNEKNAIISEKDEKLKEYEQKFVELESMEADIKFLEEKLLSLNEKEEVIFQQKVQLNEKEKELMELRIDKEKIATSTENRLLQNPSKEMENLEFKIKELETKVLDKDSLNCGLMSDLTESQKTIKILEDKTAEKDLEMTELKKKMETYNARIEEIEKNMLQKDTNTDNLNSELEKCRQNLTEKEKMCQELESVNTKYKDLEKDSINSSSEKEKVIQELKVKYEEFELLQTATLQEKDREIETLFIKIRDLEASTSSLQKEKDDRVNELSIKLKPFETVNIEEMNTEISALKNKVSELESEKQKVSEISKEDVSNLNEKLQSMQSSNSEFKEETDKEVEILKHKLKREEEESFKREQALIHGYKAEIENLMGQIHKLKCQLKSEEQGHDKESSCKSSMLSAGNRSPRKECRHLAHSRTDSAGNRSPRKACLSPIGTIPQSPISSPIELRKYIHTVTSPNRSLQSLFSESSVDATENKELLDLRNDIKMLKNDLDQVNEKNVGLEKQLEVATLSTKDMEECLLKEKERHKETLIQVFSLETELTDVKDNSEQSKELQQKLKEIQGNDSAKNEIIDKLSVRISEITRSEKHLRENKEVFDQKIESLTKELELKDSNQIEKLKVLTSEKEKLHEKILMLENSLNEKGNLICQLEGDVKNLQESLDSKTREYDECYSVSVTQKQELSQKQTELVKTLQKIEELEVLSIELRGMVNASTNKCEKCPELSKELLTLRETCEKMDYKKKELKAQYESQVEDNESLLEQFEKLQNELEELKALENSNNENGHDSGSNDMPSPKNEQEKLQMVSDQPAACQKNLEEVQAQNEALTAEVVSLKRDNTEQKQNSDEYCSLKSKLESVTKTYDELKSKFTNLEQMNNELKVLGDEVAPLRKQLDDFIAKNEELNVTIKSLQKSSESSKKSIIENTTIRNNLKTENEELTKTIEKINVQYKSREDEVCRLDERIRELNVERDNLSKEMDLLKQQYTALKERFDIIFTENEELKQHSPLQEVNGQLTAINVKYESLQQEHTCLRVDNSDLAEKISSMEIKIEDYENEISELKYSLSVKNDVVTSFNKELSKVNEINIELKEEKNKNEKLTEELNALLNKNNEEEENENKAIQSMKKDLEQFNELKSDFVIMKIKCEETEKEKQALMSSVDFLSIKNEENEKCLKDKENLEESLKNDIDRIQREFSELTKSKQEVVEQLNDFKSEFVVLKIKYEETEKEKQALAATVDTLHRTNEENEKHLKDKVNSEEILKNDIDRIQKEIDELVASKQEAVEAVKREMDCLIVEKQCLEKALSEKVVELEHVKTNLDRANDDLNEGRKASLEHDNSVANLQDEIDVLSKAKHEMERFVEEKNSEIAILEKNKNTEIHNLQCLADERSATVMSLKDEISHLSSEINNKNIKMQNLQESYKDLKSMIFDKQFSKDMSEKSQGSSEAIDNLVFERKRNRELQALVKRLEENDPVAAEIPGYNRKLRKEKIEAENALINARYELDCLKRRLENSKSDKQETTETPSAIEDTLSEELTKSQDRERKLRSQLQDACKNMQDLNKKIDELEERNNEKVTKLHETQNKLSDLENQMGQSEIAKQSWNKMEGKLKEANEDLSRKNRKIDLLKEKLILERDKFEIALKDAKANDFLIETLKDAIKEQEETMTCQDQVLNDKTEEIKTLNNEMEKITDKYHQMIQSTGTTGREMRDMVRTQARLEADNSQLQQQLREFRNNVNKLESETNKLKKSENDCQSFRNKLQDANEKLKKSEKEIEELELRLTTQEATIKKLQELGENAKCDKLTLENKLQDACDKQHKSEKESEGLEVRVKTQEATIKNLQEVIQKFECDKQSLQNKLQDAYERQHVFETEKEQLKIQITTQESTVKRLEELVEKYSVLETQNEDLEKKVSEQTKVINSQDKTGEDKKELFEKYSFLEIEKENLERLVIEKDRLLKNHEQSIEDKEQLILSNKKRDLQFGQMVGKCASLEAEKKLFDKLILEKEQRIQDIVEKCALLEKENKKMLEKHLSGNEELTDMQNKLEKDSSKFAEKFSHLESEKKNLEKLTVDQDRIIQRLEDVIKKMKDNKESTEYKKSDGSDTSKLVVENRNLKSVIDDSNKEIKELEKCLTETRQELEVMKTSQQDIIDEKVDQIKKELNDMIQELKVKIREKDHKFRESDREHRKADANLKKALLEMKLKDENLEKLLKSLSSNEEQLKKWKKDKDEMVGNLECFMKKQSEELKQLREERSEMVGQFTENSGKKTRQSAGSRKRCSSDCSDQVPASRSRRRKQSVSEEIADSDNHEMPPPPLMMTIKEEPIDDVDQKPPLRSSSRKCKKIAQDKIKDMSHSPKPVSGRSLRCAKKSESQV